MLDRGELQRVRCGAVARTEHYDDPTAPSHNSLVPAASAIGTNDRGEILMQRRVDNNFWALPGGTMDFGETIVQTAEREVRVIQVAAGFQRFG